VTEALNEGADTVQSSVTYTLGANVETLTLTGGANINATGNGDANVLTGNTGNNVLDGGVGADTAAYTGVLAQSALTFNGTQWIVNGGAQGTDTLSNIEIIEHGGGRYLLVDPTGHSGFADATAAAAAATRPGDTLVFATPPGGTVTIDLGGSDDTHDLTIPGDAPVDITVGGGDNQITTGGGDNQIATGGGDNQITTGDGDNQITTGDGDNHITTGGGDNHITTGGGDNQITTGDGNNEIETGDGNNEIETGGGDDHVTTGGGDDTIHTGDGDDVVHAGGGDDTIVGGQGGGNDFYDGGIGVNTVEYPSATNSITVDLNEIDRSGDPIIGGALGDVLATAALPADTPVGYAQGADIGIDVLINVQNATGGSGDDTIIGNSFNNILDGGLGDDTMIGGLGDDMYVVDSINDAVVENVGEGTDMVDASIHYRLGANFENLMLLGSADLQGYGNELANTLTGNDGSNVLDGGAGADTLQGGLGNDAYFLDNGGDVVIENANDGNDAVYASIDYRLGANVEYLVLQGSAVQGYGNSVANAIAGNGNDNLLDGGAGGDAMYGGAGNDFYFVDNSGDVVIENANDGNDTVYASIDYRLSANVEYLVLQGGAVQGYGNSSSNAIVGTSGNNLLNGEGGADAMYGGAGNDVYFVDNAGDVVIENVGEGNDTVFASIDYRLATNVDNLILQEGAAVQGYGNSGVNAIIGNSGNNLLNGEAGADKMFGGAGNDVYFVDNIGDQVIENLNEGTDAVFSTVDFTLSANVETLVLQGAGNLAGTGNALDNKLFGNTGDNTLNGGTGADRLTGGAGNDTFVFNAGEANGDVVVDFAGNGALPGDSLSLVGYDAGASFANIDATHWQVNYNGGLSHDIITFSNAASIAASDYLFV
jgi:Ca2+-binding RTX toxin-like protein